MAVVQSGADNPSWWRAPTTLAARRQSDVAKAVGLPLLFGLRLWASVCLALYVAFSLELDNAQWAGISAAFVCQPHLGASLRKGWFRLMGTVAGALAIIVMTACFPQDRAAFLVSLALWGAACALIATLLRNYAAYAAALAGYTAVIIATDQLGATGGLNGQAFILAVGRASEICIGIVCAGIVLAGTDLGSARRRLATLFATISAEITTRFTGTLANAGAEFESTQTIRRELVRRVVALDPVVDEAFGESSELRYHSPVLQQAVDGLLAALAGWRAAAVLLARSPPERARQDAGVVLAQMPAELCPEAERDQPKRWMTEPIGVLQACDAAARKLVVLPAGTPSLRLLAEQTAEALAGISRALNGLALLVADPARSVRSRSIRRPRVADWLPSLVNAGRAFVVIGATELFWIATEWPNGATAIIWAAIGVILFAPLLNEAYTATLRFTLGTGLGAALAAIITFAVLPNKETFAAFSIVICLVLIPAGAGMAQPWQTAIFTGVALDFVGVLSPVNQMSYNTVQFYNSALAIVVGLSAATLSFRLILPLSPAFRTRRLLALTLRDLRRLTRSPNPRSREDWESRMYGRLSALPDEATPLQRAQLLAAVSAGREIIRLRHFDYGVNQRTELDAAFRAMAQGDVTLAIARLARLDHALQTRTVQTALCARAGILSISELLAQHGTFFAEGSAR